MPVRLRGLSVALAGLLSISVSCSADSATTDTDATGPPMTTAPVSLDGLSGELILTRQRDLLDRGLINVQFRNDSTTELTMTTRQLIVDHFDTEPAEPRTSKIPNGRPVNLQVPYGVTNDCDQTQTVAAWLAFSYTESDGAAETAATVPLTGTELLDTIRSEQCTQRAFDAAVTASFAEPTMDGDAFRVDLTFTPTASSDVKVEVQRAFGTILVGVDTPDLPITVTRDAATIAVDFSVIRCDPHAMAEVTKRFGLELRVSIDDAPHQLIDIDVTPLDSALTDIVEHCRQQATNGG